MTHPWIVMFPSEGIGALVTLHRRHALAVPDRTAVPRSHAHQPSGTECIGRRDRTDIGIVKHRVLQSYTQV